MELLAQRNNKEIFRDGGNSIKRFSESVPAGNVLHEALNQARAAEAGLPAPPLREVKKTDGRWAIVSEFIEGETVLDIMTAAGQHELADVMERFVRLQTQVHAARAPQLQRLKDKLNRRISGSRLDATTRYELHVRLDAMHDHQKVCHGDFVPSNIILRGGEIFIIDWAHATQGNAAADAANTYIRLKQQGYDNWAELYLSTYCELSDTAAQYIQKWLPIVAGAALATCAEKDRAFYAGFCTGIV